MVTKQFDFQPVEETRGEFLTPAAAARLFRISEAAVRAARLRGYVASPVVMGITGKAVHLLDVRSAFEYWGQSRAPDPSELNRMRRNGVSMNVEDGVIHVLHSHPVLDFSTKV